MRRDLNLLDLSGRIALVTGAGRGLGAAIATQLAALGATVIVNDINEENARQTSQRITESGGQSFISGHDVSNFQQARSLIQDISASHGTLDILVNNAGIIRDGMLHKLGEDAFDQVIAVNLKSVFNLTQGASKVMREKKYGRIVNVSSTSRFGNLGQANYAAAKAGVVGLTRTSALELARYGVTVNAIAPGVIDTDMSRQIPDDIKEKIVRRIPLGRVGESAEVGHLVAFLSSDASKYVTGQVIQIDGGFSVGVSIE